eukprot:TRINITY_DN32837_c1_g1_i1.p1 TRINITY_DN32837_c1_g1~~TRINITY_DN32837_c1_g1_i1.p1  ORF type:complete len:1786 (-),score=551.77 TRINITY_DN32837_c1_g1_i1:35-5251(-)
MPRSLYIDYDGHSYRWFEVDDQLETHGAQLAQMLMEGIMQYFKVPLAKQILVDGHGPLIRASDLQRVLQAAAPRLGLFDVGSSQLPPQVQSQCDLLVQDLAKQGALLMGPAGAAAVSDLLPWLRSWPPRPSTPPSARPGGGGESARAAVVPRRDRPSTAGASSRSRTVSPATTQASPAAQGSCTTLPPVPSLAPSVSSRAATPPAGGVFSPLHHGGGSAASLAVRSTQVCAEGGQATNAYGGSSSSATAPVRRGTSRPQASGHAASHTTSRESVATARPERLSPSASVVSTGLSGLGRWENSRPLSDGRGSSLGRRPPPSLEGDFAVNPYEPGGAATAAASAHAVTANLPSAAAKQPEQRRQRLVEVSLAKSEGGLQAYGFTNVPEVTPEGEGVLRVTQVSADGLLAIWNARCPGHALLRGDRILAVNGSAGDLVQMRELLRGPSVHIVAEKCSSAGFADDVASMASPFDFTLAGNGLSGGSSNVAVATAGSHGPAALTQQSRANGLERQHRQTEEQVFEGELRERDQRILELERQLQLWRSGEPLRGPSAICNGEAAGQAAFSGGGQSPHAASSTASAGQQDGERPDGDPLRSELQRKVEQIRVREELLLSVRSSLAAESPSIVAAHTSPAASPPFVMDPAALAQQEEDRLLACLQQQAEAEEQLRRLLAGKGADGKAAPTGQGRPGLSGGLAARTGHPGADTSGLSSPSAILASALKLPRSPRAADVLAELEDLKRRSQEQAAAAEQELSSWRRQAQRMAEQTVLQRSELKEMQALLVQQDVQSTAGPEEMRMLQKRLAEEATESAHGREVEARLADRMREASRREATVAAEFAAQGREMSAEAASRGKDMAELRQQLLQARRRADDCGLQEQEAVWSAKRLQMQTQLLTEEELAVHQAEVEALRKPLEHWQKKAQALEEEQLLQAVNVSQSAEENMARLQLRLRGVEADASRAETSAERHRLAEESLAQKIGELFAEVSELRASLAASQRSAEALRHEAQLQEGSVAAERERQRHLLAEHRELRLRKMTTVWSALAARSAVHSFKAWSALVAEGGEGRSLQIELAQLRQAEAYRVEATTEELLSAAAASAEVTECLAAKEADVERLRRLNAKRECEIQELTMRSLKSGQAGGLQEQRLAEVEAQVEQLRQAMLAEEMQLRGSLSAEESALGKAIERGESLEMAMQTQQEKHGSGMRFLHQELEQASQQNERLRAEVLDMQRSADDAGSAKHAASALQASEVRRWREELSELPAQLASKSSSLERAADDMQSMRSQLASGGRSSEELRSLQAQMASKEAALERASEEARRLHAQLASEGCRADDLEDLRARLGTKEAQEEDARGELQRMQGQLDEKLVAERRLQADLAELRSRLASKDVLELRRREELQELQAAATATDLSSEQRKRKLEAELASRAVEVEQLEQRLADAEKRRSVDVVHQVDVASLRQAESRQRADFEERLESSRRHGDVLEIEEWQQLGEELADKALMQAQEMEALQPYRSEAAELNILVGKYKNQVEALKENGHSLRGELADMQRHVAGSDADCQQLSVELQQQQNFLFLQNEELRDSRRLIEKLELHSHAEQEAAEQSPPPPAPRPAPRPEPPHGQLNGFEAGRHAAPSSSQGQPDYMHEHEDDLDKALEVEIASLGPGCLRGVPLRRDPKARPKAGMLKYMLGEKSFMLKMAGEHAVIVRVGATWVSVGEWVGALQAPPPEGAEDEDDLLAQQENPYDRHR